MISGYAGGKDENNLLWNYDWQKSVTYSYSFFPSFVMMKKICFVSENKISLLVTWKWIQVVANVFGALTALVELLERL